MFSEEFKAYYAHRWRMGIVDIKISRIKKGILAVERRQKNQKEMFFYLNATMGQKKQEIESALATGNTSIITRIILWCETVKMMVQVHIYDRMRKISATKIAKIQREIDDCKKLFDEMRAIEQSDGWLIK